MNQPEKTLATGKGFLQAEDEYEALLAERKQNEERLIRQREKLKKAIGK